MPITLGSNVVNSLIFAFMGVGVFIVSFIILDLITPYKLWHEIIEKRNQALALVVAAVSLGICFIVGMAIH